MLRIALLLSMSSLLVPQTSVRHQVPASEMKSLGLVGGTSWHSTVDYYRDINQAVNEIYGDNTNPPLILYNLNQQHIHALQRDNRWDEIANILSDTVLKLRAAGAQAVLFCANTPHKVYSDVSHKTDIPILHIGDATGMAVQKAGLTKVGLIGTIYTMDDPFMRDWLRQKYHIETIVPSSPAVRSELQRMIQKELGMGIFKPETKRYVLKQIEDLRRQGAQGIILGCTEFPLIINQSDVDFPLFDTTKLHSQMAVGFIMGGYQPRPPEQ